MELPKQAHAGSSVVFFTPPRERRRAERASAFGHSATCRLGGKAGVGDNPRFLEVAERIPLLYHPHGDRPALLFGTAASPRQLTSVWPWMFCSLPFPIG